MIKAIIKNGEILPLEPIPERWCDGYEVSVDELPSTNPVDIDAWAASVEELAAKIPDEDHARLEAALAEADVQAKAWVRREMGLDS